jgi:colicin import membrane protein
VLTAVSLPSAKPFEVGLTESLPIELISPQEFEQITKGSKTSKVVAPPSVRATKTAAVPTPEPKPDNLPEGRQEVMPSAAPPPPPPEPQKVAEAPKPAEPPPAPPKAPEPKPEPPKEAEAPKPVEAPKPEPKPPEPKKAETPPEKPPEPKKAEAKPEKPKPPEPKPQKTAKPAPEKKPQQQSFDLDKVAALVDKRAPSTTASVAPQAAEQTTAGLSSGTASNLSVSERRAIDGMIRDRLIECWNPPVGMTNAAELIVKVEFRLNPDGSLAGNPVVVNSGSSAQFRAASDSALRAVRRCVPLDLPPDSYDYWQSVHINFDPREMVGG